jgi:hypothetical protein
MTRHDRSRRITLTRVRSGDAFGPVVIRDHTAGVLPGSSTAPAKATLSYSSASAARAARVAATPAL